MWLVITNLFLELILSRFLTGEGRFRGPIFRRQILYFMLILSITAQATEPSTGEKTEEWWESWKGMAYKSDFFISMGSQTPVRKPDQEIIRILKHALKDRGDWLNTGIDGTSNKDAEVLEKYISARLELYSKKFPQLKDTPIKVFVYKDSVPNAWVAKYPAYKSIAGLDMPHIEEALGIERGKGFIEFGITTALLETLPPFNDAIDFVVGHEAGHVIRKDIKDAAPMTDEERLKGWADRHISEFGADSVSIKLNAGVASLDEFPRALSGLFALGKKTELQAENPASLIEAVVSALKNGTSSHPHEGVRVGFLEAQVMQENKHLNAPVMPTPMDPIFLRLGRSEQKVNVIPEIKAWRQGKSIQDFLAENSRTWTQAHRQFFEETRIPFESAELEIFINTLERSSHTPYVKLRALFTNLIAVSKQNEEFKESRLITSSRNRLESWLSQLTPAERTSLVRIPADSHQILSLLARLSVNPGNPGNPGNRDYTETEKLALDVLRSQIDKALLGKSKGSVEALFPKSFQGVNSPKLRYAAIATAVSRMKEYAVGNIAEIDVRTKNTDVTKLSADILVFFDRLDKESAAKYTSNLDRLESLFFNIKWMLPFVEGTSLKIHLLAEQKRFQNEIFNTSFRGYQFPRLKDIQIKKISDPMGSVLKTKPAVTLDDSAPPFDQLRRLSYLRASQLSEVADSLVDFMGDILSRGFDGTKLDLETLMKSVYKSKLDDIAADAMAKKIVQGALPNIPLAFSTWHRMRSSMVNYEGTEFKLTNEPRSRLKSAVLQVPAVSITGTTGSDTHLTILSNLNILDLLLDRLSTHDFLIRATNWDLNFTDTKTIETFGLRMTSRLPENEDQARKWLEIFNNKFSRFTFLWTPSTDFLSRMETASKHVFSLLPETEVLASLKNSRFRATVPEKEVTPILKNELVRRFNAKGGNYAQLPGVLENFEREFSLGKMDSVTFAYRNEVARELKLQPQHHVLIDPAANAIAGDVNSTGRVGLMIRGFSGLIELVRSLSVADQIQFIHYITGKSTVIPAILLEIDKSKEVQTATKYSGRSVATWLAEARQKMQESNEVARGLIVHSFFAGPNGLFKNEAHVARLENALLSDVPNESRDAFAMVMKAVRAAEGANYTLLLSYAMGQKKMGDGNTQLNGAELLKAFLESYGVPGIKFGQFLSFSSRFKHFRSAFESFQDEARPLSYIGMLKLLEKNMGVPWDAERFEVIETKGSGSVNIAVKVMDKKLGSEKIINILRADIEIEAKNDFRRFQNLINEINKISKSSDLAFVGGVAKLVEDSTSSEFDKERAKRMHDVSERQYSHTVGEWTVKSVHVDEAMGRSLVMDVAQGESARKVLNEDPETYKKAMGAFLVVAKDRADGNGPDGKPSTKPIISDPDIHNGQFFIDKKTKTITLLDKGQGNVLSVAERELAKTLFRVATNLIKGDRVEPHLNRFEKWLGIKLNAQQINHIHEIQKMPTVIDRYLNIVAYLREIGRVPTASVDWGFEFYRLHELANQVGRYHELAIRSVVLDGPAKMAARASLNLLGVFKVVKKVKPTVVLTCRDFYY